MSLGDIAKELRELAKPTKVLAGVGPNGVVYRTDRHPNEKLLKRAADALDAKDKRIAELEAGGWQPIETAPKDEGATFLAANTGSIERWHTYKEGCVVTRHADVRSFTCFRLPGGRFMDEFGDEYLEDGRIHDAEDLTADDDVLRLIAWCALPTLLSSPAGEANG